MPSSDSTAEFAPRRQTCVIGGYAEVVSESQAERNYAAYKESFQADLERDHLGEVVLLHDCAVVDLFGSEADAYNAGVEKFGIGGEFSLQKIGAEPISLGIFSALL